MNETLDIQAFAKAIHEVVVLAALRRGPLHGYQIALDLERRSGGLFVLTHGTLYPILHRLEADGAIRGAWSEEGGRRRKEYELTRQGLRRLAAESDRCEEVMQGVLRLTRDEDGDVPDAAESGRRPA